MRDNFNVHEWRISKIREENEQNIKNLKKGDRVRFKADSKVIWNILGVQGDTYRINQQGERSISYQPIAFLHNMISTGKASIDQNESLNLEELQDFDNKGYKVAKELIDKLRATTFKKFNDDELEEFRKTIANAFDFDLRESISENFDKVSGGYPYRMEGNKAVITEPMDDATKERMMKRAKEYGYSASPNMAGGVTIRKDGLKEDNLLKQDALSPAEYQNAKKLKGFDPKNYMWDKKQDLHLIRKMNEDKGTLNKIADILGDKFDDLNFDVNEKSDRIDVRGSQQDLTNFGDKSHGKKIYGYEVFATDDDDRGEIVRIVKSDKLKEGDGLWANIRAKKARGEKPARKGSKAYKIAKKAGDKINKEK